MKQQKSLSDIMTKTGDGGLTSLFMGPRVSKDNLRIEACGSLDELCSFLGLAKSMLSDKSSKALIQRIQKDLFVLGAEIATPKESVCKLKDRIGSNHVRRLEDYIKSKGSRIKLKGSCFILPGKNVISGCFDVARVIARKSERNIVTLRRKNALKNSNILIYLNRLSDLLYIVARQQEI